MFNPSITNHVATRSDVNPVLVQPIPKNNSKKYLLLQTISFVGLLAISCLAAFRVGKTFSMPPAIDLNNALNNKCEPCKSEPCLPETITPTPEQIIQKCDPCPTVVIPPTLSARDILWPGLSPDAVAFKTVSFKKMDSKSNPFCSLKYIQVTNADGGIKKRNCKDYQDDNSNIQSEFGVNSHILQNQPSQLEAMNLLLEICKEGCSAIDKATLA